MGVRVRGNHLTADSHRVDTFNGVVLDEFERMRKASSITAIRKRHQPKLNTLFYLCVCLTAWRGPIPWGHAHEELASGALAEPASYQHWWRHHGEQRETASKSTDWHWHWLLPSDICPDECGQSTLVDQSRPAAYASQVSWLESSWSGNPLLDLQELPASMWSLSQPLGARQDHKKIPWDSVGFLNTFPDAINVQSLIGVALC